MIFLFIKILLLFSTSYATSAVSWDFAVTTSKEIFFYNEHWSLVTKALHQFDDLTAIAFDETEEIIYFNDQNHQNGSIFTLQLLNVRGDYHVVEKILSRTKEEEINGMTFDPVERMLYWTDAFNKKIYKLNVNKENYKNNLPIELLDFSKEDTIPCGISVDMCRRKLYWTNKKRGKQTIETLSLNDGQRNVIIDSDLFLPRDIIVDQLSDRIYWVDDRDGIRYSVESSKLDGSDRKIIVKESYHEPFNLAVTEDSVYWTDRVDKAVMNISKFVINGSPKIIQSFNTIPRSILARENYLTRLQNDNECKNAIEQIKTRILDNAQNIPMKSVTTPQLTDERKNAHHRKEVFCLNKGDYSTRTGKCICKPGYIGIRCETHECYNYCIHGKCNISLNGLPECKCYPGYDGENCENYKCSNYCLNNGKCKIENDQPKCDCGEEFIGKRCELNVSETCSLFCEIKQHNVYREIPRECDCRYDDLFVEQKSSLINNHHNHTTELIPQCSNVYNKTIILVCFSILTGLILVYLIIQSLRRIYKPARPRIKKTIIIQKQEVSQTPLTSRPVTTSQCEITIENCCNQNICDTPCFDTNLLQQNMSLDSVKEDKRNLINNAEENY